MNNNYLVFNYKYMVYKNKKDLINNIIKNDQVVLDVGFWGQGKNIKDEDWVHSFIINKSKNTYGLDLDFEEDKLPQDYTFYFKQSAENFNLPIKYDLIFAGDLIEHLSNPGLFLNSVSKHLNKNGFLVLTTPNAFSLFNIAEKISKYEPTVNSDHTCYFNLKTMSQLLKKNNFNVLKSGYIFSLENKYKQSYKKKILNILYKFLSFFTDKYVETFFVIATPLDARNT